MWKSGDASRTERETTSSTDRARANFLSHFCWMSIVARINDRASVPAYDQTSLKSFVSKNDLTWTPVCFHIGPCASPYVPVNVRADPESCGANVVLLTISVEGPFL